MSKPMLRMSPWKSVGTFLRRGACSETVFTLLDHAFVPDAAATRSPEERASGPLAGGIMRQGYQCGMVWGAALAAGAEACRRLGPGPQAETQAVLASQKAVESFAIQNKNINCSDLTIPNMQQSAWHTFKHFIFHGGAKLCFGMAKRFPPVAFDAISTSLSQPLGDASSSPASCSALLTRNLGGSDAQACLLAGFAGGVGLCGGGCGALGAALWMTGLRTIQEGAKGDLWSSKVFQSRANEIIDRFLKSSGHQYECSEIVGRKFESAADHARHLRDGGCAKILQALAER
jgi:hypothetical protein